MLSSRNIKVESKPNVQSRKLLSVTGKHHFSSPDMMQSLLEAEGIRVNEDKILNFKNLFWDPNEELKLWSITLQ